MSRLVIFKAKGLNAPEWEGRTLQPSGALTDILSQHFDYSIKPAPGPGYRLLEFKHDPESATFDHQGSATHHRESPWRVARVDEYVGNTGQEEMAELLIAYCDYAPLPEEENPWVEMAPAGISLDSFGGDVEAFEAWKKSQQVTA